MGLRAAVIHGGAPDVYDSRDYFRYFRSYAEDPISDLEIVVARCLSREIFGDSMIERTTTPIPLPVRGTD